jgi:hypothetical protein
MRWQEKSHLIKTHSPQSNPSPDAIYKCKIRVFHPFLSHSSHCHRPLISHCLTHHADWYFYHYFTVNVVTWWKESSYFQAKMWKKIKTGSKLPINSLIEEGNCSIEELNGSLIPNFIFFTSWLEQMKILLTMLRNLLQNNNR